jgi:DUF4097 and DUF4098 domain-containing protein YvlB
MSTPPNMPPGGAPPPFPPFDKHQQRLQREQKKAAWRTQREAWKAQCRAWKTNYKSIYGPRVPSMVGPVILIVIGVVALLLMTGRLNAAQFWAWNSRWWPLMLIIAGLALLAEWALDMRRGIPVRRGGGVIPILILFVLFEIGAAGWNHLGTWRTPFDDNNDNFFNSFGQPQHDLDQQLPDLQVPANASIEIENPRGDISITAEDSTAVKVQAHEVAYAGSDADAKKIFDAEAAHLTVSGSAVLIHSESNPNGRLNLTISVPKSAHVSIESGKGDVTVAGLGAGLSASVHGDLHLSEITGAVDVRFKGNHDFSAHDMQGDLTLNGNIYHLTVSDLKGKLSQNGEIGTLGDVHLENISGAIHMRTAKSEVEVADLPGDLTLDPDDLHINEAKGPVRVATHSKDIDLNQVYGDCTVEDNHGTISVEPAGAFNIDAKNGKGDIEVTLPPNASATVDGRTHNGDILNAFGLPVSGETNKIISGKIGSGAIKISLITDVGDISIKKGPAFPSAPLAHTPAPTPPASPKQPMLNVPPYHRVPDISKEPHLKPSSELPPKPVTQ